MAIGESDTARPGGALNTARGWIRRRGPVEADAAEARFVADLRAGTPAAWARLYDTHHGPILRYVAARVRDRAAAEELAADVFVQALEAIGRYRYTGRPILAWLYRIARNLVVDHVRALERRGRLAPVWNGLASLRRGPGGLSLESHAPDADPQASVAAIDVRDAVRRLPGDQREAVILRFYAGLPTPEVAKLLGRTDRAVYSLYGRAFERLRRELR